MLIRYEIYVAEVTAREGWYIWVCALAGGTKPSLTFLEGNVKVGLQAAWHHGSLSAPGQCGVFLGCYGSTGLGWVRSTLVCRRGIPMVWGPGLPFLSLVWMGGVFLIGTAASGCQHWLLVRVVFV